MPRARTPATLKSRASTAIGTVYSEFDLLMFAGLNNRDASIHIGNNEASDLMNVHFDNKGAITKRNGYTLSINAFDTNPIVSVFPFYMSNGTKKLITTSGTSIFDATPNVLVNTEWATYQNRTFQSFGNQTWANIDQGYYPNPITTTLTGSNKRFTAAVFYDKLYMMNGVDGLMSWDGTTFATVSGAPNGQYVVTHKNRLYIAGDPANPSRLYMSDLGLPASWPALNFIDVDTNDGDKITGIVEHLDALVIFKERSVHVLRGTGPQNYNLVDAHQSKGCVSHWTAISILGRLYYLSRDGVYEFDGKASHLVSDIIRGSVLGLNGNQAWNQQYLSNACAVDYMGKYWLCVPEGSSQRTNNRVYVFDYTHNVWTRYDLTISCLSLYADPTTGVYHLFTGSPLDGNLYQQDTGATDNGQNINAYLKTKDFDFGAPAHFKSYKGLFFAAEQQLQDYAINITYTLDLGRQSKTTQLNLGGSNPSEWGSFVWGVSPWGSIPNVATKTTAVAGQSRYLSFKVSDNSANPWVFLGWALRYQVKRRMA